MATIQKRGNSFRFVVSCGYDINGKQYRETTTWTPPEGMTARKAEREAQRQAVLFEEKCRSGQILDGSIKFADFAERWFTDYAERNLRPATVSRYCLFMPRINAAIGHIRLDKFQPHHLLAFYKNLEESWIREASKYRCVLAFKALLRQRGLTKRKFAPIAGVSVYVLDSITRGNNISQSSAEKIAAALDEDYRITLCPLDRKG